VLRSWGNQKGVTLTELMAAVVVLGIVVIPFTNIGTTIWKQYAVNKATNEATIVAEQHLDEARGSLEMGNLLQQTQQQGVADDHLSWTIHTQSHSMTGLANGQLIDVTITVQRTDPMTTKTSTLVTLSTVVRKKG
jgi:prepilin-type N-terminal cleavage/methylation domain-containing protein